MEFRPQPRKKKREREKEEKMEDITMPVLDVEVHPCGKTDKDENDQKDFKHTISKQSCLDHELVLVVPQKLTKHAQNVIYSRQVTPLRYHLEGRFGSRTHRIDDSHMGLPLTSLMSIDESKALLEKAASQYEDVRMLINNEGVKFLFKPYYDPSPHKARQLPYIDARIHPEREPLGVGSNKFWKDFAIAFKDKSGARPGNEFNHTIQTAATIHQINHLSLQGERERFTYAELFAGKHVSPFLSRCLNFDVTMTKNHNH